MLRVLVDENLPRSLAEVLRQSGFDALDVRDVGLAAKTDREVYDFAASQRLTIITRDREFGNYLLFPLGSHSGVVIVRYPTTMKPEALSKAIVEALQSIPEAEVLGNLLILERHAFGSALRDPAWGIAPLGTPTYRSDPPNDRRTKDRMEIHFMKG